MAAKLASLEDVHLVDVQAKGLDRDFDCDSLTPPIRTISCVGRVTIRSTREGKSKWK